MSREFDTAAGTYDTDFDGLPATARIRNIVCRISAEVFPAGGSLLELNCGTGTDAIALARNGFQVLATDSSPAMIDAAQQKAKALHSPQNPEFRVLPFDELPALRGRLFDGVLSNMGGLNCIADLRPLATVLGPLLKPGACLVATVLSDISLWETSAFLFRLDFRKAFRRKLRNGEPVPIRGGALNAFYHSPSTIRRSFRPYFEQRSLTGLNIFTPPPSSTRAYRLLKQEMNFLNSFEDSVSNLPLFNRLGDHFVVVLQRTNDHKLV